MRTLFFLTLSLALCISCEKETNPVLNEKNSLTSPQGYFPLEIGNYWIYQHVHIDSMNSEVVSHRMDSVVVTRDTILNGHRYYVLEGTNYPFNGGQWDVIDLLRDSAGYIVTSSGDIRFASDNYSDVLAEKTEVFKGDTLFTLTYKMESVDYSLTVPAGTFVVQNFKGTVFSYIETPIIDNPRYLNNLYAEGVGKVLQTYFYLNSPVISEKRLVRYHIEQQTSSR